MPDAADAGSDRPGSGAGGGSGGRRPVPAPPARAIIGLVSLGDRHVLLVGAEPDTIRQLTPALRVSRFTVHTVPASELVLDLIQGTRFEVVLVCYPLADISIVNLIRAMRDRTSSCRNCGLLLLTQRDVTEQARSYLNRGANRVLTIDCGDQRLLQTVNELINVAPRVRIRTLVSVEVGIGLDRSEDLGRAENLSRTGMLLCGTRRFPVGTELDFEFFVDGCDEAVRGTAEVVRTTDPEREGVDGLGVRFSHLVPGSRERLDEILERSSR